MLDFTSSSGSYPIRPTGSDEWEGTRLNGIERVCEDDGKVWAASARLQPSKSTRRFESPDLSE